MAKSVLTRAELDEIEEWVKNPFNRKMPPTMGTGFILRLIAHVRAQEELIKKKDEALREIERYARDLGSDELNVQNISSLAARARAARMEAE